MAVPTFNAQSELRHGAAGMADYIEAQLAEDASLADAERTSAPLAALRRAVEADDLAGLLSVGADAVEWIERNATEEERFDWAVNCPNPYIDRWSVAKAWLEAGHEEKRTANGD
jgi:hypothetical protein